MYGTSVTCNEYLTYVELKGMLTIQYNYVHGTNRNRRHTCMSLWGFQSESYITTVSAVARLMPRPPARVESRNTLCLEPGVLNRSMEIWRSVPVMFPSILSKPMPRYSRKSSRMSSIRVICRRGEIHITNKITMTQNLVIKNGVQRLDWVIRIQHC